MLRFLVLLLFCYNAMAGIQEDPRFCGFVPRTTSGDIKRSSTELKKFQRIHPCPSTGLTTGSCPYFDIDHIIPLSSGGCDLIINMQWLPNKIKNCKDIWCKDRWERNIYNTPIETPGFKPLCCTYKLITFPEQELL